MDRILTLINRMLTEARVSGKTRVWHASPKKFDMPFDEKRIGSTNDSGTAGRGFSFFGNEGDTVYAAPRGFKREFELNIKKPFDLDKDDPFSEDPPDEMSYEEYQDVKTLELLKQGYDCTFRTLNGRLDEICVLSFKKHGFDGNKIIKPVGDWKKV